MKRHPNYKGGVITAAHGYVLRFVGKAHHLADCRGYAYEHRLAMEKKLGRLLEPREVVHHLNGIKSDNRPSNLEIKINRGVHISEHFRKRTDLRPLGSANPVILCACGCGQTLNKYDNHNRPKRYVPGHQSRGKKHWWNHNSWSKRGAAAQREHLNKMRNNRWHSAATRAALNNGG